MSGHDLAQREMRRLLRAKILRAARIFYGQTPNTLGLPTIMRLAGRFEVHENDLREEIQYLVDLKYLERRARKIDALDTDPEVVWCLTARGMQILNGDLEDLSIVL